MRHRGRWILTFGCLVAAWFVVSQGATTATGLTGRIELAGKATGSPSEAVVYFEPSRPASVAKLASAVMVTRGKTFEPGVLVVTKGTTVRFPNQDPILHNVFSVSPGNTFDLGFYRRGDSKDWTFTSPGLVRVFCNVHYSMTAHILVLDTPFHTRPDATGAFALEQLPAGKGKLHVWHERAQAWSQDVVLPRPEPLAIRLELGKKRVVPHLNKLGKPYEGGGRDDYR